MRKERDGEIQREPPVLVPLRDKAAKLHSWPWMRRQERQVKQRAVGHGHLLGQHLLLCRLPHSNLEICLVGAVAFPLRLDANGGGTFEQDLHIRGVC
jgi:hypothetical protein